MKIVLKNWNTHNSNFKTGEVPVSLDIQFTDTAITINDENGKFLANVGIEIEPVNGEASNGFYLVFDIQDPSKPIDSRCGQDGFVRNY